MSMRIYLMMLVSIARLRSWLTDWIKTQRMPKESASRNKRTEGVRKEKPDVVRMKKIKGVKMRLTDRCLNKNIDMRSVSISARSVP